MSDDDLFDPEIEKSSYGNDFDRLWTEYVELSRDFIRVYRLAKKVLTSVDKSEATITGLLSALSESRKECAEWKAKALRDSAYDPKITRKFSA